MKHSSIFANNSEADASELLENIEEKWSRYYVDSDVTNRFKHSILTLSAAIGLKRNYYSCQVINRDNTAVMSFQLVKRRLYDAILFSDGTWLLNLMRR